MLQAVLAAAIVYLLGLIGVFFKNTKSDSEGHLLLNRYSIPALTPSGRVVVCLITAAFGVSTWTSVAKSRSDTAARAALMKQNDDLKTALKDIRQRILDEKVTQISAVVTYRFGEEALVRRPKNARPILGGNVELDVAFTGSPQDPHRLRGWSNNFLLSEAEFHIRSVSQLPSRRGDVVNDGGYYPFEVRRFDDLRSTNRSPTTLAAWTHLTMEGMLTVEPVDEWLLSLVTADSTKTLDAKYGVTAELRRTFADLGTTVDGIPVTAELEVLINGKALRSLPSWTGQLAIFRGEDQVRPRCIVKFPPAVVDLGW